MKDCKRIDINDYEFLLKKMLYSPVSGQELFPAFGVAMICQDSKTFRIRNYLGQLWKYFQSH